MSKLPIDQLFNKESIDPPLPPVTHRFLEIQFLSSIKSNFDFHKGIADGLSKEFIAKFDHQLSLSLLNENERHQAIKEEMNQIAKQLAEKDVNRLSEYLDPFIREQKISTDLEQLKQITDEEYYHQIATDYENRGYTLVPFTIPSDNIKQSYLGLHTIWSLRVYYDYLHGLINNQGHLSKTKKPEQKTNQTEVPASTINIHPDVLSSLHEVLLLYFVRNDMVDEYKETISSNLMNVLKGNPIDQKLVFYDNGNKFIYIFRELLDHHKIQGTTKTMVKKWIIQYFSFSKDNQPKSDFAPDTVYTILTSKNKPIIPNAPIALNFLS